MSRRAAAALALVPALVLAACSPSPKSAPETAQDRGAVLYEGNCVACHQATGAGIQGVYPSLAGSAVAQGDIGVLARWVVRGERPASMPEGRYNAVMPRFGWLTDADAAALFSYVRANFGNHAPAVDAAAVASALSQP